MQLKNLLQSEGFFKLVVLFGGLSAVASIIMGWGGLQFGIDLATSKMMRLVPGSATWETWKTVPLPVYIKFNLFNITNPEEMANGAKPFLTEMGPYVYLVDFDKFDFARNDTLDTILYSPTRTYFFQSDKSKGKEEDLVTYVNVMFLTVSHFANDFTDMPTILETLDKMLVDQGEKLTRTDTVVNLLFRGVSIQTYVDLVNDPFIQRAGSIELPTNYEDGLFALFKGKNGTKDGRWEVHAGIRDNAELGKIHSVDGKRKLSLYSGDSCNSINGTDGTLNPPFVLPGVTELFLFIPELCRSIRWEFVKTADMDGIPVARYKFPKIKTPQEDPGLACFCPKDSDPGSCEVQGIANLAECFDGAPLLYSKPHFLQVQKSVRDQVEGMKPNALTHESQLDIHPLTGVAVRASIKMQFSIELIPWESMSSFRNASKAIIPFVWIELLAELTGFTEVLIYLLALFLKLLPILRWLGLVGCLGIMFLGLFFGYQCRKNNNIVSQMQDSDEDEQDAKAEHEMWLRKFNKKHAPDSDDETVIRK